MRAIPASLKNGIEGAGRVNEFTDI